MQAYLITFNTNLAHLRDALLYVWLVGWFL
jgi:hypothetical protein